MFDDVKEVFNKLNIIYQKWKDFDFVAERERILKTCSKKLMSISYSEMFYPDQKLLGIYPPHKGRLTKDEKARDYAYYFDDKNRLVLTEWYNNTYNNIKILDSLKFHFYYSDTIETVRIAADVFKKASSLAEFRISIVYFLDYRDDNIIKYFNGFIFKGNLDCYDEYVINDNEGYAFTHSVSYRNFKESEPPEKIILTREFNTTPPKSLSRIMRTPNKHLDYLKTNIKDDMSLDEIIDIFQNMCKKRANDTDILFETGVYSFSGPDMFYFSLTRQYPGIDDEYLQLLVNIQFKPTKENINLQESIWDFEVSNIFDYIKQSESYLWAKKAKIKTVDIMLNET